MLLLVPPLGHKLSPPDYQVGCCGFSTDRIVRVAEVFGPYYLAALIRMSLNSAHIGFPA